MFTDWEEDAERDKFIKRFGADGAATGKTDCCEVDCCRFIRD